MTESQLQVLAESIDGLTTVGDCYSLYARLKDLKIDGDVLEIGSFKGRVTVCLAKAIEEVGSGKLYTIDANIQSTKPILLSNISKHNVENLVVPIFKPSVTANNGWSVPLKFIWIDTDFNYFSASCDFILWERYLAIGGIIAFAGANVATVNKVISERLVKSGRFAGLTFTGAIGYAVKVRQGEGQRLFSLLYLKSSYYLYYLLKRVFFSVTRMLPIFRSDREFMFKKALKSAFDRLLRGL